MLPVVPGTTLGYRVAGEPELDSHLALPGTYPVANEHPSKDQNSNPDRKNPVHISTPSVEKVAYASHLRC